MNTNPVISKAMEAGLPNLRWRLILGQPTFSRHPGRRDAVVGLTVHDDQERRFSVEVKHVDRFQTLTQLADSIERGPGEGGATGDMPLLLVAPYISPEASTICRQRKLNYIDTAGNAFIDVPGCFVLITGNPKPKDDSLGHGALRSAATLRVIFALLLSPDLARQPMRDVARLAGVSLGSVANAMDSLRQLGHLSPGKETRRLLARRELSIQWAQLYPIVLRETLNPRRYSSGSPDWWKFTDLSAEEAVWGGEVGAAMLTSYLRPQHATVYCMRPREEFVSERDLWPDPKGNIEILDAFWSAQLASGPTAPPLLVYADLLASLDDRNREVAQLLEEQLE